MRFAVLGPLLLVTDADIEIRLTAPRQRALLAALLLRSNEVVSADALTEIVWDGAPPARASVTLRSYVMRLRNTLGPAADRIITRDPGYLIVLDESELDVLQFETLCRRVGAAIQDQSWAQASWLATRALSMWRGTPLLDVDSRVLKETWLPRLQERRLQTQEWRIDAELRLGHSGQIVDDLRDLTTAHPLRERFHAQLMSALVRTGRRAAALEVYQQVRLILLDELGIEPGTELRQLQQRILDGTAEPVVISLGSPSPGLTVPRQLPATVHHFTGRAAELGALSDLLSAQQGGTVMISAIGGTAGVGKTALALHWAQLVLDRFPDGQLFVNLRGYDSDQPVSATDALSGLLIALGVSGRDIPPGMDERAARYRSEVAGRRMLVVIDNAASVEQVRPLLPGSPSCVALVTSRDSLAGLVARDGARRLDLDLLCAEDAVGLLRALIGDRADAEPDATAMLADQCSRLPLALRVAAELAVARPGITLAALVSELTAQQRRLDVLDAGGDPHTAIRAVFSGSYRHLDQQCARAFRLWGLHPGSDWEAAAAAALIATTPQHAGQLLGVLSRAHLIQPSRPGRYGMHDLLRAYAVELTGEFDTADERHQALTRLFDHYLHTAAAAMNTLFPGETDSRPCLPDADVPCAPVSDPVAARDWLDSERENLVAVAAHAAAHAEGWPEHPTLLAHTLFRYFDSSGYAPQAVVLYTHARNAARRSRDRAAEAVALNGLGTIDKRLGRYQEAADRHRNALALFREIGDRMGEARALGNLGLLCLQQSRYPSAEDYLLQALPLFRELGDRSGEGFTLNALSEVQARWGRFTQAANYLRRAQLLFRETGNLTGEAAVLEGLGDLDNRQGHHQQAADHVRQALDLFRRLGDRSGETYALNLLGEILLLIGRPEQALTQHIAALGLAGEMDDRHQQARAHRGIACAYQATGSRAEANQHWQQALALYTSLEAPEADQIRAQLASASSD